MAQRSKARFATCRQRDTISLSRSFVRSLAHGAKRTDTLEGKEEEKGLQPSKCWAPPGQGQGCVRGRGKRQNEQPKEWQGLDGEVHLQRGSKMAVGLAGDGGGGALSL